MRSLALPLVASVLATAVAAQNPRASQQLDTDSMSVDYDPVVTSDGNLSVASWVANTDVMVSLSDGTGTSWSMPVQVDSDTTAARKDMEDGDVVIVGNTIYVTWRDQRSSAFNTDVYLTSSTDGGATWAADKRVPTTVAAGVGEVDTHRMVVAASAPQTVYIFMTIDPDTTSNEELYLVRSTDGGATFQTPIHVPQGNTAGTADVQSFDAAVVGSSLYVAWHEDRTTQFVRDTFFQLSNDGGTTWLPTDMQLNAAGDDGQFSIDIAVRGTSISVAWPEEPGGSGNEVCSAAVSTDGGASFTTKTVGGYTPGTDDVDYPETAIATNGNVVVAWMDNRTGGDQVYAAITGDGGATWNETFSSGAGGFPRVVAAADSPAAGCPNIAGTNAVIVSWTGGGFPEGCEGALSRDGGATWLPQLVISDTTGDADFAEATYNALYNNFVVAWLSDDNGQNDVYVGGFRPQTVTNNGWGSCPKAPNLSFDFSGYDTTTSAVLGVVAMSAGTGPWALPLPGECRNVGLAPDSILATSLGTPMIFSVPLSGPTASTPSFPNPFGCPTGTTIYYAGLFLTWTTATQITDTGSFQL